MNIDNGVAMKLWKDVFGDVMWATDCFGTYIYKDDYGVYDVSRKRPGGDGNNHFYGWDIDHIRPKSDFQDESDANFYNNFEPMHRSNNEEKLDNFPHFSIGKTEYKVVSCEVCKSKGKKGYGIQEVSSGIRIDWKWKQKTCYV